MTRSFVSESLQANPESPLEYLAEPDSKHLAILYENEKRAKLIQFWYLIHGLTKGEHCIYTTHLEIDEERARMKGAGLDVEYYEKERGLLHIRKIEALESEQEVTAAIRGFVNSACEGGRPPYRSVFRLIDGELKADDKVKLVTKIENGIHMGISKKSLDGSPFAILSGYQGSMMCHHPVEGAGLELVSELIAAHDATVFVSKTGDTKLVRNFKGQK